MCIQKLETAINQTPISSIGRKDPLPFCVHVAYKCKWALYVMNVNLNIKKSKSFSKKKPFVVVRMQRNNNPLLGAMFGYNNSYVAVFDLSLIIPQKEWEDEDADLDEFFKRFKKLVEDNLEEFKFYDFSIKELTDGLCNSVLIVSTKQTMSTRRVLSLTDKESSFAVAKQSVISAITKKRYKPLDEKELEKLQNSKTNKEEETNEEE